MVWSSVGTISANSGQFVAGEFHDIKKLMKKKIKPYAHANLTISGSPNKRIAERGIPTKVEN